MSTLKIWDLHMELDRPFNDEMMEATKKRAESIAEEPGIIWKIWTNDPNSTHMGSTYLFRSLEDLEKYKAMHIPRLEAVGVTDIKDYIFDVMEDLSRITRAPLGNDR